jgi:hypothetical protein
VEEKDVDDALDPAIVSSVPGQSAAIRSARTSFQAVELLTGGNFVASGQEIGHPRAVSNRFRHMISMTFRPSSTVAGERQRLRNALVIAQVGASLMLLIIAGLFTRSLAETQRKT